MPERWGVMIRVAGALSSSIPGVYGLGSRAHRLFVLRRSGLEPVLGSGCMVSRFMVQAGKVSIFRAWVGFV